MSSVLALLLTLALLAMAGLLVAGCGSSATTSPAEAKAVAVAEKRFLNEWAHAYHLGMASCRGLTETAGLKCLERVEHPLQGKAIEKFAPAIEAILDDGVGPECAKSLEDANASMPSVPSFAGSTTAICREESQKAS